MVREKGQEPHTQLAARSGAGCKPHKENAQHNCHFSSHKQFLPLHRSSAPNPRCPSWSQELGAPIPPFPARTLQCRSCHPRWEKHHEAEPHPAATRSFPVGDVRRCPAACGHPEPAWDTGCPGSRGRAPPLASPCVTAPQPRTTRGSRSARAGTCWASSPPLPLFF